MRRSSGLLLFFGLFLRASAHDRLHCDDSPTYTKDLMSGEIKSPGFPHRYLGFLDCRWTLEPKQDWAIAIDFEFFSTEPQYDYVTINQTFFAGNQLQSMKQAVLSGDKIFPVEFFSSVGGGFEIRFHTDASSHEYPGFRLRFQRFQPAENRFACPLIAHETLGDGHHAKLPPFPTGDSLPRTSCPFPAERDRGAVNLLVMDVGEGLKVELYQEDYLSPNHYGQMETPFQTLNGISFSSSPKNIAVQQKALYMIVTIVAPNKGTELEIEYFRGPNLCDCGLDEVVRCGTHLKADPALPNPLPNVDRVIQLVFNEFDVEAMHDIFGLYSKGRLLKM
ncbi:hypothetical protein M3Y99_00053100 [Aphelenchoides fujianensis]|nr:hypothetical protein M3Y99_00053100 [Aphelenchoides fujianensis]